MRIHQLKPLIEAAWSIDTTYCPEDYHGKHPSYGQCAVTAMAVQFFMDGFLRRGMVQGRLHYWNSHYTKHLDLTDQQFEQPVIYEAWDCVTGSDLISNPWMMERFSNFMTALIISIQR